MTTAILQKDEPLLRDIAEPVAPQEFGTVPLQKILHAMSAALAACDDGVAIAAPQIGVSKRIFVVAGRVFLEEGSELPPPPDMVFINPSLTKLSSSKIILDEGCLSVRGYYGKIERAEKATVEAYDFLGKKFSRGAAELLAQIFQHEVDHLDGVLFIDRAISLEEAPRKEVR
ncbi:MAG: peptide deformylase [Parcubacteria group bacterium RIFOXYD2_FULL_52_8]|nr:MAG: peptide deformylase [Parcubacteria group bacterium RIFOXYD2_FULL_52_8]